MNRPVAGQITTDINSMWKERYIGPSDIIKLSGNNVLIEIIEDQKAFGECIREFTGWSTLKFKTTNWSFILPFNMENFH
jgi:hypothetical protein